MSPLSDGWGRLQVYMPNETISNLRMCKFFDIELGDSQALRRFLEWAIENEDAIMESYNE